jgi:hypothetical protein
VAYPTTAIKDDFNRANGALGASWTKLFATDIPFTISSYTALIAADGGYESGNYYNVATYGPDCEAYATVSAAQTNASSSLGIEARLANAGGNTRDGYHLDWSKDGTLQIYVIDDGAYTAIGSSTSRTMTAGYKFGIVVTGGATTTIKAYTDEGAGWVERLSVTDSTSPYTAAGNIAIHGYDSPGSETGKLDDFGGGTVASGTTLTVQEASHSHSAESKALIQHNKLTAADANHSLTSDNITLLGGTVLTVAETSHVHSADTIPALKWNKILIFFGVASTPADNGTNTADPTAVTPPGSMQSGDLVLMIAQARAASGTLQMSEAGGQTWTSLTQTNQTTCRRRVFWCTFNGTWSANPSVAMGSTTNNIVVMLVFRHSTNERTWAADNALVNSAVTAPGSPYTVTVSGITIAANSVGIAMWAAIDDITWSSLTGADWSQTGLTAQYRNTSGSDESCSFAYKISIPGVATGDVSQKQSLATAGAKSSISFKEVNPVLTVAETSHAVSSDAPTLVQHFGLIVQDATHAHSAETKALVQHNRLTAQEAAHSQAADAVVVTAHAPTTQLTVQQTDHSHTADNVTLTQHNKLVVAETSHAHTAEAIALIQHNRLAAQEAAHSQAADAVVVTAHAPTTQLTVQQTDHSHTADNVTLTQHNKLVVAETSHAHAADNVIVTYHPPGAVNLTVAEASHSHSAESKALIQHNKLVVAETSHAHGAENVTVTYHPPSAVGLTVAECSHAHAAESPALKQHNKLAVAETSQAHTADNVTLTAHGPAIFTLTVAECRHTHSADSVTLTQHNKLVVADTSHAQLADNVTLMIPGTGAGNRTVLYVNAPDSLAIGEYATVYIDAPESLAIDERETVYVNTRDNLAVKG